MGRVLYGRAIATEAVRRAVAGALDRGGPRQSKSGSPPRPNGSHAGWEVGPMTRGQARTGPVRSRREAKCSAIS